MVKVYGQRKISRIRLPFESSVLSACFSIDNSAATCHPPASEGILADEENQAVVIVLNEMVSESKKMMYEIRKLDVLLCVQGVRLEARLINYTVKTFADSLSREWDPIDVLPTQYLSR